MSEEQGPSNNRRVLFIVLGILGGLALLSCVVCGAGGMFCAREIQPSPREAARIEPSLYIGNWAGEGPTTLTVDSNMVRWEQYTSGSGGHISYSGNFAGISGQDIRIGVLVTEVTLVVSDPPHQDAAGAWVMTVEGVPLTRQ